jgi:hypothetical protein
MAFPRDGRDSNWELRRAQRLLDEASFRVELLRTRMQRDAAPSDGVSMLARGALPTVSAAVGLPSFLPLTLAAANAALVRSLMRRASPWRNRGIAVGRHICQEPVHRLQPI